MAGVGLVSHVIITIATGVVTSLGLVSDVIGIGVVTSLGLG